MLLQSIKIILLGLVFCCLIPFSAQGRQQAEIKEIVLTDSEDDLLLYFQVTNAFTVDMENGIKNGIPVSFTFYIELQAAEESWTDKNIVTQTFDHTLTYDNLKQEYRVEFAETGKNKAVNSLAEAKKLMTEIHDYKLASLTGLVPARYRVRLKVRLAKKTLPLNFQYVIPFWNLWEFETDWYVADFVVTDKTNQTDQTNKTNKTNKTN